MAQTVCILLGDEDRLRLAAIAGDRNRPQKHVQRARIVLLSGERLPVLAVACGQVLTAPARGALRFLGRDGETAPQAELRNLLLPNAARLKNAGLSPGSIARARPASETLPDFGRSRGHYGTADTGLT
jgi:hypothetical protein